MNLEAFFSNLPQIHSWDSGKTWHTGGFYRQHLEPLYQICRKNLPEFPSILETGAGTSTILFLLLSPGRLVSIAPEADLFRRIGAYCDEHAIATKKLEHYVEGSEWALPRLAQALVQGQPCFDFALIDGCHNWPMVFLDFFYCNYMLKAGGYLMIDDVQLHSVKELARMLMEQPDFHLEADIGKSLIFRRVTDRRILGEWNSLPYIVRKSGEYERSGDAFKL